MADKRQAPGTRNECAGANDLKAKNTQISLGYHQRRVFNMLRKGGQYSVADISTNLQLSDPRSLIRTLRHKHIPIGDIWCKGTHGGRYKRYFIHDVL